MSRSSNSDNEFFSLYLDAAKALYTAEEKKSSQRFAKKALKLFPKNFEALTLMARLLWDAGNIELAEKNFKKAITSGWNSSKAKKDYAEFLISQNRSVDAINQYQDYFAAGYWNDSISLDKMIEFAAAIGQANAILPTLKLIWQKSLELQLGFRYAHQLRIVEKYDEAIELLDLLTKNKRDPDWINELGICYVKQAKYKDAAQAFKDALGSWYDEEEEANEKNTENRRIPPQDVYWANLAFCLTELGEEEHAKNAVEQALQLDDSYPNPWQRKIEFFSKFNHFEEAFQTAQQAIDRFSAPELSYKDEVSEFYRMGIDALQISLNKAEEAQTFIEIAREKYPDNKRFYFASIDNFLELKQYEKALALFEYENKYAYDAEEYVTLVRWHIFILFRLGREDEIQVVLKEFIKNNGDKGYFFHEYDIWVGSEDINIEEITRLMEIIRTSFEELAPGFPWFSMNQAYEAFFSSDRSMARQLLMKINVDLCSNQDKAQIYNFLGYISKLDGDFDKAKEWFQKVSDLELDEKEFEGPNLSFYSFFQNGEWKTKNVPGIYLVPIIAPKSIALVNMASISLVQNDFDLASLYAIKLLNQHTDVWKFGLGYELLGYISASKNEPQAAEAAWRLAIEANANKEDMESNILQLAQKK